MISKYPKMKTLYALEKIPNTKKWGCVNGVILPEVAPLHFYSVEELLFTEKIDGTNMAIEVLDGEIVGCMKREQPVEMDSSNDKYYVEMLEFLREKLSAAKNYEALNHVTFFGELCGDKVQKGKNYFPNKRMFLCFDIYDHVNGVFFRWSALEHFCNTLEIPTVPVLEYNYPSLELDYIKDYVTNLFSVFNENYPAEGIVVRYSGDTSVEKRYIAKIRKKDFGIKIKVKNN